MRLGRAGIDRDGTRDPIGGGGKSAALVVHQTTEMKGAEMGGLGGKDGAVVRFGFVQPALLMQRQPLLEGDHRIHSGRTLAQNRPSKTSKSGTLPLGLAADGKRSGGLRGQNQESEALLDVEPHPLAVVLEIADREILPDRQFEIATALGDHQAAVDAGALGCSLSGSGPSLFALCRNAADAERVARAMTDTVQQHIPGDAQTYISSVAPHGARVVPA